MAKNQSIVWTTHMQVKISSSKFPKSGHGHFISLEASPWQSTYVESPLIDGSCNRHHQEIMLNCTRLVDKQNGDYCSKRSRLQCPLLLTFCHHCHTQADSQCLRDRLSRMGIGIFLLRAKTPLKRSKRVRLSHNLY